MDNSEVNYPDILKQLRTATQSFVSPCHATHMPKLTLASTTTSQGTTIINETEFKILSRNYLTNIFEMVNHPVIIILMVRDSKIHKRHYWLIFELP